MILLIAEKGGKKVVHTFDNPADALNGVFMGSPPPSMKLEDVHHMIGGKLILDVDAIQPHWIPVDERLPQPGQQIKFVRQGSLCRGRFELMTTDRSAFVSDTGMRYWTGSEGVTHWCADPDPVLP